MQPKIKTENLNILLIYNNKDDILATSKRLSDYFESFKSVHCNDSELKTYLKLKPKVVLVGFTTTEESVEYYSEGVQEQLFEFPHMSLLLCENKQAGMAFDYCVQGLFDDYVVFKPLYEVYTLCYRVFQALEAQGLVTRQRFCDAVSGSLQSSLNEGAEAAVQLREKYRDSFEIERMRASVALENDDIDQAEMETEQRIYAAVTGVIDSLESTVMNGMDELISVLGKDIPPEIQDKLNAIARKALSESKKQAQQAEQPAPQADPDMISRAQLEIVLSTLEQRVNEEISQLIAMLAKNITPDVQKKLEAITKSASDIISAYTQPPQDVQQPAGATEISSETAAVDTSAVAEGAADDASEDENDDAIEEFKGRNILIAEDNLVYRQILKKALKRWGFIVHEAVNGREAMEMAQTIKFDIAILDLFMPELDGIEATRKIRSMAHGTDLPIIALSGNKNKSVAQEWVKSGLNDYLLKPINSEKLILKLRKHMKC